jgi:ATP-dependent Clp protease adaptor protein ClpS
LTRQDGWSAAKPILGIPPRRALEAGKIIMPNDASERSPEAAGQPPMFRVLLLNDDFTPMEFVVYVLESVFDMNRETATRLVLQIHHQGKGECGIYPVSVAAARAKLVQDLAREHQHPLSCVMEPAS